MSDLRVPPFDLLTGHAAPFEGLGDALPASSDWLMKLQSAADEARSRIETGFGVWLDDLSLLTEKFDVIIREMWAQGWSPDKGNINLFVRDFGLVLAWALLSSYGGTPIVRSEEDITHFSIWWSGNKIEVFPFHHMLKCFSSHESDSVTSFVKGVSQMIRA